MKNTKLIAAVLAVLLAAAEANIVKFKTAPRQLEEQESNNEVSSVNWTFDPKTNQYVSEAITIPTWPRSQENSEIQPTWDLGLTATVNDYVDNTLHLFLPFMREHGLDPMILPEIVEGFEIRVLFVTYSAWLRLTDGAMTGLVNITRFEDQQVNYFAKNLRVRVNLQFNDLEFVYNYLIQVMNIGPIGQIVATLDSFRVVVDVLIDFNNDEIQLQEFKLTDIGRLRVRLRGNILYDWLLNPVITVFTTLFNGVIMGVVELTISSVAKILISVLNSAISDVITAIEAFN